MSLLVLRGQTMVSWVYDTAGNAVETYDLPPGGVEGVNASILRTQCGSPDGSVWMGVLPQAAGSGVPPAQIQRVDPMTGTIYEAITLSGTADISGGYSLCLLAGKQFLVATIVGSDRTLQRFGSDGSVLQTYGLPSNVISSVGVTMDGTTAYWSSTADTVLHRWDLVNDVALADFGDIGASWQKAFQVLPDGGVLVPVTLTTINAFRLSAGNAIVASYSPSDSFAQSQGRGIAWDLSTNRVYCSTASGSGSVAGTLAAYPMAGGSPIWSVRVPLFTSNTVSRVVLCPPLGAAMNTAPASTAIEPIKRRRRCPHLSKLNLLQFHQRFELIYNPGNGSEEVLFGISWSDEGGAEGTYIPPVWISGGTTGQHRFRAFIDQLGQARDRVYQVEWTSNAPVALIEALLTIEGGIS